MRWLHGSAEVRCEQVRCLQGQEVRCLRRQEVVSREEARHER